MPCNEFTKLPAVNSIIIFRKSKLLRGNKIKVSFQPEKTTASKWYINSSVFHRQEHDSLLHYSAFKENKKALCR